MKKLFFIVALFQALLSFAQPQVQNFKVFFMGREIGTLDVFYKNNGGIETIEIKSVSLVKVLFTKTDIDFYGTTTYQNNVLVEAFCRNIVDDKIKTYTKISKLANKYLVYNENEKKEVDLEPVKYSAMRLYYEEPIAKTTIFSESWGEYCPIEKIENRVYQISLPNGKKSKYFYDEKGSLLKVENNHAMGKISFEKI
jgi:hypothetical protein